MADHNTNCTMLINQTGSISGKTKIGTISKSALTSDGRIVFTVSCNGQDQKFYIVFNATK